MSGSVVKVFSNILCISTFSGAQQEAVLFLQFPQTTRECVEAGFITGIVLVNCNAGRAVLGWEQHPAHDARSCCKLEPFHP